LTDVVHGGRERGQEEMLVGLQARHHQPADREDDRADEVQAHEFSDEQALFCREAGNNDGIHDLLREDENEHSNRAGDEEGEVGNAREQVPCGFAALCCEVFAHQRDERHRQRAAGDEREQHVWHVVGGVEHVEQADIVRVDARDDAHAHEGEDFVDEKEESDQNRRTR